MSTQVTIEDLSISTPAPAKAPASTNSAPVAVKPSVSAAIDDLGQITFAPPVHKNTTPAKPEKVESKNTDKPAKKSEKVDKKATKEKADEPLAFDLVASEKIITAEHDRLMNYAPTRLDKDDFVPDLTALLDLLTTPNADYDTVVAGLDALFDGIDDHAIVALEKKFRQLIKQAETARDDLATRVDDLLASFPAGNNWYRLLAAWEVLSRSAYHDLATSRRWLETLSDQSLSLLGDAKADIQAAVASGVTLDKSIYSTLKDLEKDGLQLGTSQEKSFIALTTPSLQKYVTTVHTVEPKKVNTQVKNEEKAEIIPPREAANLKLIEARLTTLQKALMQFTSIDLSAFARAGQLQELTEKLERLERQTSDNLRQLSQESSLSVTKISTQIEQNLTSKLDKQQQDFAAQKLQAQAQVKSLQDEFAQIRTGLEEKITGLDEVIADYKKSQITRDQEQNHRLNVLGDKIKDIGADSLDRSRESNSQLDRVCRDNDERFEEFSRQLTDLKTDQIRIDQVQTSALAQLTTKAQESTSSLTALTDRLEQLETENRQLQVLKTDLSAQLQTVQVQLQSDLASQTARLEKMESQIGELHSYASRLEAENEELRLANAGLKQENWQVRTQLGQVDAAVTPTAGFVAPVAPPVASQPAGPQIPFTPLENTELSTSLPTAAVHNNTPEIYAEPTAPAADTAEIPLVETPIVGATAADITADIPVDVQPIVPPEVPAPAPIVSNLARLGLSHRLSPGSRLLTGQPLDFLGLNQRLATALTGTNSFSAWLHAQQQQQASFVPSPAIGEGDQTLASGGEVYAPTNVMSTMPAPAANLHETVAIPDVEPTPIPEVVPPSEQFVNNSSAQASSYAQIEDQPLAGSSEVYAPQATDTSTFIPVPPAFDEPEPQTSVLPTAPVFTTTIVDEPAPAETLSSDTVVLPFAA